jgi:hypothetical protein
MQLAGFPPMTALPAAMAFNSSLNSGFSLLASSPMNQPSMPHGLMVLDQVLDRESFLHQQIDLLRISSLMNFNQRQSTRFALFEALFQPHSGYQPTWQCNTHLMLNIHSSDPIILSISCRNPPLIHQLPPNELRSPSLEYSKRVLLGYDCLNPALGERVYSAHKSDLYSTKIGCLSIAKLVVL